MFRLKDAEIFIENNYPICAGRVQLFLEKAKSLANAENKIPRSDALKIFENFGTVFLKQLDDGLLTHDNHSPG